MKNVVLLTSLILGYVIGAGFVTGREIVVFFDCPTKYLIWYVLIFMVAFILICFLFLYMGYLGIKNTRIKRFYDYFLLFSNIILSGCLLSATKCIGDNISSFVGYIFLIVTLGLGVIVSLRGVDFLQKASAIIVPMIIILMYTLFSSGVHVGHGGNSNLFLPILYVSMNLCMSGQILIKIGERCSVKHIIYSCIMSSIILSSMIFLIRGHLYNQAYEYSDMPILYFVLSKGQIYVIMYNVLLYLGIFTSLIFSLATIRQYTQKWKKIYSMIPYLIICSIAVLPFGNVVAKIYPMLGIIGTLFIAYFAVNTISNSVSKRMHYNAIQK